MRLLPCGDRAILVELDSAAERRALDAHLARGRLPGIAEHVPAATTVLLRLTADADPARIAAAAGRLDLTGSHHDSGTGEHVVVPVRYDGTDLESLAGRLGVSTEELVAWHTATPWTVDFAGFAPGFGYLHRDPTGSPLDDVEIPRLDSPRKRIVAGSVALAGRWSAVYPSDSPGGWQLIGRTDLAVWDGRREPPALMRPGVRVRFEVAR